MKNLNTYIGHFMEESKVPDLQIVFLCRAVNEQAVLNRSGTDIFVSFSSRFKEVSLPDPGTVHDDGLTKES